MVHLRLTPSGQKKVTELIPLAVDCLNDAFGDFSKAEFSQLAGLLHKFIDGMKARQKPAGKMP